MSAPGRLWTPGRSCGFRLKNNSLKCITSRWWNIRMQQICGVEALVRWRHPERGLVHPLNFIGIAEETGLIVPLGSWVLHEACRHLSRWRQTIPASQPFKVSVNVSPRQLQDETFFADLQSALHNTSIRPGDLQLEVTESVFLNNPERIGALLMRIRQLGVRIACDDFGTGYSSLSYLQLYPIDMIKVDQSFVKKLDMGQLDIVRMIVGLAHSLRMNVSAEGVANLRQQEALRELGCSEVQGFLYSEPVSFEAMTELLGQPLLFAPPRQSGERRSSRNSGERANASRPATADAGS